MTGLNKKGPDLFQKCLAASFALHVGVVVGGMIYQRLEPPVIPAIDLEMFEPRLGTGAARLGAPKKSSPDAKGLPKPAEETTPLQPVPAAAPPKDWVTPRTMANPKPVPSSRVVKNGSNSRS